MKFLSIAVLSMNIVLVGCGSTEVKEPQPKIPNLNNSQLKTLLVGNTTTGVDNGSIWTMKFNSDGTLIGKDPSGNDMGKYTINENKFCRQWQRWSNGKRGCFTVKKRANDYYAKNVSSESSYSFNIK